MTVQDAHSQHPAGFLLAQSVERRGQHVAPCPARQLKQVESVRFCFWVVSA
jgi:hypothetical protein